MKRVRLGFALLLILVPAAVSATEVPVLALVHSSAASIDAEEYDGLKGNVIRVHGGPVFLGCVYSYHECEHVGHRRGFYNHFTRHDHRTCHHGPSYACYGR